MAITRSAASWNGENLTLADADYSAKVTGVNPGYIPEVWAGKLIERWYNASVIAAITSTDYEGLIKSFGDNVRIRTEPAIQINDYVVGQALDYEVPGEAMIELSITEAKSWAFTIDDIDKHQSDLNLMSIFADSASEQLKVHIDSDILGADHMKDDAHASNKGSAAGVISGNINLGVLNTPVAVTELNAVQTILAMGQALDEQSAPETGRWVVIPAAMAAVLKDSVIRSADVTGDSTSPLRNGKIGMIDRFTVYTSNNLPSGGGTATNEHTVYAGIPSACAFASQIVKNETLPNPDSFGELMRGLQVYGYKTVKPEGLVELVCTVAHT